MDNCDSWEDMEASVPAPAPALAVASKLNANAPAFSSSPSFNPFHPAAAGFTSHKPQQVPGLPVSAAPHTPLQEDVSVRVAAGIVNAHAGIDSACFDFVPEDLQNIQASSDDSFGGAQSDEKEVGFQDFLENVSENDSDAIDVKEEASTCSEPVNRPATDNEDTAELNLATLNIKDKHMQDDESGKASKLGSTLVEAVEENLDTRQHLNVVFIGHVDAGKSTIGGQILYLTNMVDERTIQKYEREAKEKNRESWYMAYIMDTNEEERAKSIFTAGYKAVLHIHSVVEECEIMELLQQIDPKTKKPLKKKVLFVKSGAVVVTRIQVSALICVEKFEDFPQLGRFTLRDEGKTVAIGKVVKLPKASSQE